MSVSRRPCARHVLGKASAPMARNPTSIRHRGIGIVSRQGDGITTGGCRTALQELVAVDHDITEIAEYLGGPVTTGGQVEKRLLLIQESRRTETIDEDRMVQQIQQEGDVGLHATDAEFAQTAVQAAQGIRETTTTSRDLYQKRIVEGIDHRPGKDRTGVEAYPCRWPAIVLHLAIVLA